MNWLKQFGSLVLKIGQIVAGIAPVVRKDAPYLQTIANDLEQIARIIQDVEVIGQVLGSAGPDKLKMAAPLVAQVVVRSDLLAGRRIADATRFQAGVTAIASGMADVLSSLEAEVQTVEKTT